MTDTTPDWLNPVPFGDVGHGELPGTPQQRDVLSEDQMRQMREQLLESILSSVVQAMRGLFVPGPFGAAFDQLSEWATTVWDRLQMAFDDLGKLLSDLWNNPWEVISNLIASMIPGLDASKILTGQFAQEMVTGLVSALSKLGGDISKLLSDLWNNPWEVISNLIASMIPGLDASKILTGQFAQEMVTGLVSALSKLGSDIVKLLSDLWNNPWEVISNLIASMIPGLDASKILSGQFAQEMVTGLVSALSKLGSDIVKLLSDLWNNPWEVISNLIASMIPGLDASKILSGQFAQEMVTGLVSALSKLGSDIVKLLSDLWNNPWEVISNLIASMIPGLDASKILSGQFAQEMVTGLVAKLGDLTNWIQDVIDMVIRALTGIPIIGGAISGILQGFEDFFTKLYGQKTPANTIQSPAVPALDASKVTSGFFGQNRITNLVSNLTGLANEDAKTNNAIYNSYFGSGGNGSAEDTAAAITDIKAKLAGEWNIETITTSRTWTRANSWTVTPSDLWVVCCGSGNGGGSGEQRLDAQLAGQGGEGGRWLVKQVVPSTVPETVTCTVGVATAGSSTSHVSPNNGKHTSFGSLCATNDGITASIVSFISYYSADDARPGRGGNGGGPQEPSWVGSNGQSTPLATGGIGSVEPANGGPGGAAVLTGDTRAGGGGGGGGGGAGGLAQGRDGGNGGHPGGGGGGGGVQSSLSGRRSVGGGGASGVIILMWR